MEELCDKHQNAMKDNLSTDFDISDFYNISVSGGYLSRIGVRDTKASSGDIVLDTMKEYAEMEGFLEIEGDIIRLTKKGLDECQESTRDWD